MSTRQIRDSDDISTFDRSFNTAESSVCDSESNYTSNIHQHCRPRRPEEPERKGKAKLYYCKYCETGSSTSTTGLRSHIRTCHKDVEVDNSRPTLSGTSATDMKTIYDRLYE
ncbi:hypothetical protein K402DRAFT_393539, partial [Aulographum hederae CBS 113979]